MDFSTATSRTPEWTQKISSEKDEALPGNGSPEYVKAWFLRAGSHGECACAEAPQILAKQCRGNLFFPMAPKWTQHPCVPGFVFSFITLNLGDFFLCLHRA